MTTQMIMDFNGRPERCGNPLRPHHRTTTLTTTKRFYDRIKSLNDGGMVKIEAVNDVVSSARGGQSVDHHMLRRSALLRRQFNGGYGKVKVRHDGSSSMDCRVVILHPCSDDECSFYVTVSRLSAEGR